MVKLNEIVEIVSFFDDCEYIELRNIVNREIEILDVALFENKKGSGAAAKITVQGDGPFKIVTHSKAVVETLGCDAVRDALANGDSVVCTVNRKRSKDGREYYTLS